jgi:hypothetical protein
MDPIDKYENTKRIFDAVCAEWPPHEKTARRSLSERSEEVAQRETSLGGTPLSFRTGSVTSSKRLMSGHEIEQLHRGGRRQRKGRIAKSHLRIERRGLSLSAQNADRVAQAAAAEGQNPKRFAHRISRENKGERRSNRKTACRPVRGFVKPAPFPSRCARSAWGRRLFPFPRRRACRRTCPPASSRRA